MAMPESYHIGAPRPALLRHIVLGRGSEDSPGLQGIARRFRAQNHEGCNCAGVWLSTLAASLRHGLKVLEYGEGSPEKSGREQIAPTVDEDLLEPLECWITRSRASWLPQERRSKAGLGLTWLNVKNGRAELQTRLIVVKPMQTTPCLWLLTSLMASPCK